MTENREKRRQGKNIEENIESKFEGKIEKFGRIVYIFYIVVPVAKYDIGDILNRGDIE